ncbi:ZC3H12C family protein [Megaselia abdita]
MIMTIGSESHRQFKKNNLDKKFLENLGTHEGEDSSYDSDDAVEDKAHEQVSRTTSDTLAQEYADYITSPVNISSTSYKQKVEFALKLGYTERLVQAALSRLGTEPTQNELLAELIKLGAIEHLTLDIGSKEFAENQMKSDLAPSSDNQQIAQNMLRPIVIDGSNVAMSHGNKDVFSCKGIKICVDWFKSRGHKDITVFVPKWRKENSRIDNPIFDQEILSDLEKDRMLVFTPSRLVGGKRLICYDDRYILKLAVENDGIVVSNDNYRDLVTESVDFKKVVEERILMYSFVNDRFMPPDDPLGRNGPTLDNFLKTQSKKSDILPCPYGKKCTYGNKCKFSHPERGSCHKSVTERLSEHAARHLSARNSSAEMGVHKIPVQGKSFSVPLSSSGNQNVIGQEQHIYGNRKPLCRSMKMPPNMYGTQEIPKSHSIENISLFPQQQVQSYSGLSSTMEMPNDSVNLHKKLQRQLTLNPVECDPRIFQMQQRGNTSSNSPSAGSDLMRQYSSLQRGGYSNFVPHPPLASSLSSGSNVKYSSQHWENETHHPSVTRIASAPDPSRPCSSGLQSSSTSEPHINLWPRQHFYSNHQDQRRRIHYHLSSIFPEDQVQTVMQMYPEETNPQTICAAILSMFPTN